MTQIKQICTDLLPRKFKVTKKTLYIALSHRAFVAKKKMNNVLQYKWVTQQAIIKDVQLEIKKPTIIFRSRAF